MVKHGIHVVPRDYIFTHDTQCRNAEYHNTMFSNAQLGNAVILCCVSFDECNHVKRCFTDCTVYFLSAILMNVIALQLITTIFFYKNAQIKKWLVLAQTIYWIHLKNIFTQILLTASRTKKNVDGP